MYIQVWMVIVVIVTAIASYRTYKHNLWSSMDLEGFLDWFSLVWLIVMFCVGIVATICYLIYSTPDYLVQFLSYRIYP